jgi:hypothetical protein
MATQPRHLYRLLAFLDPLLCRASLVAEPLRQFRREIWGARHATVSPHLPLSWQAHSTRFSPSKV